MKPAKIIFLTALLAISGLTKAEQVNLNELLKSKTVLEIEGDDLKIEDMSICAHDPRSVLGPQVASSLQADSVCKLLGEQLSPAQKLQSIRADYTTVNDRMFNRNQCKVLGPYGYIGVATTPHILSKVHCIPDNRQQYVRTSKLIIQND